MKGWMNAYNLNHNRPFKPNHFTGNLYFVWYGLIRFISLTYLCTGRHLPWEEEDDSGGVQEARQDGGWGGYSERPPRRL